MARYTHKVSGARVEVRDDKVMDSSWEAYDGSDANQGAETTRVSGQQPAEGQAEPPAGNASAEDWRAYAVEQHGADPEQVAGMSRNDLREQYGPRPE